MRSVFLVGLLSVLLTQCATAADEKKTEKKHEDVPNPWLQDYSKMAASPSLEELAKKVEAQQVQLDAMKKQVELLKGSDKSPEMLSDLRNALNTNIKLCRSLIANRTIPVILAKRLNAIEEVSLRDSLTRTEVAQASKDLATLSDELIAHFTK